MAATLAELEMRLRALEARVGRHDEDMGALVETTSRTLTIVTALAEHAGLDVAQILAADEAEGD